MIIIVQQGKVFATHADTQKDEITFALYPFADAILRTAPGCRVKKGDTDPRVTHPGDVIGNTVKLPTLYATLVFSGGDGKDPIGLKLGHSTKGAMDISGDIRATPDAPGLPVAISCEWRITVRQVVSECCLDVIGSVPVDGCAVVNNRIQWAGFDPSNAGIGIGIYLISDEDFATIPGAAFGLPQDYRVSLVGGAKLFKVLK